jgi:phage gpG-like protein
MVQPVTQAIFASAVDLANDAAISITRGATSGKQHQPSAPGKPPNADTHVLSNNIEGVSTGPLKAEATSNAPYAAAQEFGSEKANLPERPYMRPAAARQRPKATKRIQAVVSKVIRSSGEG